MKTRKFASSKGSKRFGKSRITKPRFVKETPKSKWKQVSGVKPGMRKNTVSESFQKKTTAQKLVASLHNKKDRDARKLFLVEGEKTFVETIHSFYPLHSAFVTHGFLEIYPEIKETFGDKIHVVDEYELTSMGTLSVNTMAIGIFHQQELPPFKIGNQEVVLALCDVNDPGNLGTLVRIADWYGITKIIASKNTVDIYNPKTISASKGSFARVGVYYQDLEDFFLAHESIPVFAADMKGNNVHTTPFPKQGILLLGNETHGIPHELEDYINHVITIPRYGNAESLNVAIAGAVILDNWKKSL